MVTSVIYFAMLWMFAASYRVNNVLKGGVGCPKTSESVLNWLPKEQRFSQKLDHFNPTDETIWLQRYWVNPTFYEKGKPAFLMINGEAEASVKWSVTGQWIEYAKQYNASCFLLEHRYYGESKPTKDASTKNLKYLSSEQALADIAYFITAMKKQYETGPWIVFGGSYAGSLAAWARLKYPHLIAGAVSSSGPLLAKIDFNEYFQVVNDALSSYSPTCVQSIKKALIQLNGVMQSQGGKELLTKEFHLCSSLGTTANFTDIQSFYENLAGNFADVVQYNQDNRESPTRDITIPVVCDIMDGMGQNNVSSNPEWKRFAAVNELMLLATNATCLSYAFNDYIDNLRKTDWNSASNYGRQWMYQTCTEFGFYQTSSTPTALFASHFPLPFFTEQCREIFGPEFDVRLLDIAVNRTNVLYGEKNIIVERVVFVHGKIDPWHVLGITDDATAFLLPDTAHCADMYPPSANDSLSLKNVRSEVSRLIGLWLGSKGPLTYIWFICDSASDQAYVASLYFLAILLLLAGIVFMRILGPSELLLWLFERRRRYWSDQLHEHRTTYSSS